MTEPRRYRMVEQANPSDTGMMLCTAEGARELGVAAQPDDDLIVLCDPGLSPEHVERWVARLRVEGHTVDWTR